MNELYKCFWNILQVLTALSVGMRVISDPGEQRSSNENSSRESCLSYLVVLLWDYFTRLLLSVPFIAVTQNENMASRWGTNPAAYEKAGNILQRAWPVLQSRGRAV